MATWDRSKWNGIIFFHVYNLCVYHSMFGFCCAFISQIGIEIDSVFVFSFLLAHFFTFILLVILSRILTDLGNLGFGIDLRTTLSIFSNNLFHQFFRALLHGTRNSISLNSIYFEYERWIFYHVSFSAFYLSFSKNKEIEKFSPFHRSLLVNLEKILIHYNKQLPPSIELVTLRRAKLSHFLGLMLWMITKWPAIHQDQARQFNIY